MHDDGPVSAAGREASVWSDIGVDMYGFIFSLCGVQYVGWQTWEFGLVQVPQHGGLFYGSHGDIFCCLTLCPAQRNWHFHHGRIDCAVVHQSVYQKFT